MARALALDLLDAVLVSKRNLEAAFEDHPATSKLEARDRALARNLAATVLRRLGQIDELIDHCLRRPLPPKARTARQIIRLGVCQLMFLRIPSHAAVDTAVTLARQRGQGPYAKLVNAVLRRIAGEGAELLAKQDEARLNTPDWLWRSWMKTYGAETCRRIAEAHLGEAPLDLTFKGETAKWVAGLNAEPLPTGGLRLASGGPVTELPGFNEGIWWVQDAAASLPARLLGDVDGLTVIDLCAAPGGKTAQLAAAGADVTAVDRSEKRLARLAENLRRLGLEAPTVCADATLWRPEKPADAVLLDAPCSATGTIRRHPDVARLKTAQDVEKLAQAQQGLLAAAAEMVRPGGLLVYAACSLEGMEGAAHIERLLASGAPFERVGVSASEAAGLSELVSADGDLRTLPCHLADKGGMDGFYAARLKRT